MADQLSEEEINEFKEAFKLFDKNLNGTIPSDQLGTLLRALGQNPTESQLQDMINELDENGTGSIEFPEFLSFMAKQLRAHCDGEEEIVEVFREFDKENTGYLSVADFRHVLVNLGEKLTEAEMDEMIEEVGVNAEGNVDYNEFIKIQLAK